MSKRIKVAKLLTEEEIKKMGSIIPMCGECMIKFIQINPTQWKGNCEHRKNVIANIGK